MEQVLEGLLSDTFQCLRRNLAIKNSTIRKREAIDSCKQSFLFVYGYFIALFSLSPSILPRNITTSKLAWSVERISLCNHTS